MRQSISRREKNKSTARKREALRRMMEDPTELEVFPSELGFHQFLKFLREREIKELVIYARVSTANQDYQPQIRFLKKFAKKHGIRVVFAAGEIASGKSLEEKDRPVFHAALRKATGQFVFVFGMSRVVRGVEFHHSMNPNARPTREQLVELRGILDQYNVELLCWNDPDASPPDDEVKLREAHRLPIGRGRPSKHSLGYKKRQRVNKQGIARRLRREGKSLQEISDILSTSVSTLWDWTRT